MSLNALPQSLLGEEDILLSHAAKGLGGSFAGLEGTLGGEAHRILIKIVIPQKIEVNARFIKTPFGETQ